MKLVAATAVALCALGGVAQAQQAGKLFFEGDIVRGAQPGAPGPFCVLSNQFKRLEKVAGSASADQQLLALKEKMGLLASGSAPKRIGAGEETVHAEIEDAGKGKK